MFIDRSHEGNGTTSESVHNESPVDRNLEQECHDMEMELNKQVQSDTTSKIVGYPSTSDGDKE